MEGGVSGISNENIDDLFNGNRAYVNYKNLSHQYYIVYYLNLQRAFKQVISFIHEIERVKGILKQQNDNKTREIPSNSYDLKKYTPEFLGKRKYKFQKREIDSNTDHGYIVDCLKKELESFGDILKNRFIDLGLVKNKEPQAIFEVKTGTTRQMIYTAVGQLMLHAHTTKVNPNKYFVAPANIIRKLSGTFSHWIFTRSFIDGRILCRYLLIWQIISIRSQSRLNKRPPRDVIWKKLSNNLVIMENIFYFSHIRLL